MNGDSSEYRIPRVEEKHAGNYKCVAVNDIGSNSHVTTLIVQGKTIFILQHSFVVIENMFCFIILQMQFSLFTIIWLFIDKPKITTVHTAVYKSNEGADVLKMPCAATGIPKPAITWKKNGVAITPSKIHIIIYYM